MFKVDFKCKRPFIFIIHEKKYNVILFMGKFMKPKEWIPLDDLYVFLRRKQKESYNREKKLDKF